MKKILVAILICTTLLSACEKDKEVKEKSSKIVSNKEKTGKKERNGEKVDPNKILLPSNYFNVLETVSGKQTIQNPENDRLLVNRKYYLSSSFVPENLVVPNVTFAFGDTKIEKAHLRQSAAVALEKMFAASKSAGMNLTAVSGYRSYQRQNELFNAEAKTKGEIEAVKWVAKPGTSEHQSGLAMDISCLSFGSKLEQDFDKTNEFKWLSENAYKFGFILRYPKGKENVTEYAYEPWHYRYVGVDVAKDMFNRGICFEEFMMNAKPL